MKFGVADKAQVGHSCEIKLVSTSWRFCSVALSFFLSGQELYIELVMFCITVSGRTLFYI